MLINGKKMKTQAYVNTLLDTWFSIKTKIYTEEKIAYLPNVAGQTECLFIECKQINTYQPVQTSTSSG